MSTEYVPQLIGRSPAIARLRRAIPKVGRNGVRVLLRGETGTGKEIVARLIHGASGREPFVPVNCAAVQPTLFEAEMFGYEKGAFTGAHRAKSGLLEEADGGTLFLDEVAELPADVQAKLLRALDQGQVRRVGSTKRRKLDVRLIAATNRELGDMVHAGTFREDLFYRLRHMTIELPPLRERLEDLPLLVRHLAGELKCSDEALQVLQNYPWPGNVRELEGVLEAASVYADGEILPEHLPADVRRAPAPEWSKPWTHQRIRPLRDAVAQFEREYIQRVLEEVGGSRKGAAEILGIDPKTLYRKLKREPGEDGGWGDEAKCR